MIVIVLLLLLIIIIIIIITIIIIIIISSGSSGSSGGGGGGGSSSNNITFIGTNGVSTNEVTAYFMFFDRGTFWVLPLTCFYLPKRAQAYFFPNRSTIITFAAAPLWC